MNLTKSKKNFYSAIILILIFLWLVIMAFFFYNNRKSQDLSLKLNNNSSGIFSGKINVSENDLQKLADFFTIPTITPDFNFLMNQKNPFLKTDSATTSTTTAIKR